MNYSNNNNSHYGPNEYTSPAGIIARCAYQIPHLTTFPALYAPVPARTVADRSGVLPKDQESPKDDLAEDGAAELLRQALCDRTRGSL